MYQEIVGPAAVVWGIQHHIHKDPCYWSQDTGLVDALESSDIEFNDPVKLLAALTTSVPVQGMCHHLSHEAHIQRRSIP